MTTQELAKRLVALCRTGDFEKAQNELFSPDAVSIEQHATADFAKETHGIPAIQEKAKKWNTMVAEMHGITVSDPMLADHSFACTMKMDITMKERGRMAMTELCVYKVKDDKIVSEEFFM